MHNYFTLLIKAVFRRWAPITDLSGGVLGVIIPGLYLVLGKAPPENLTNLVAGAVVCLVAGLILARMLLAPYAIWKKDQILIDELTAALDEPRRKGREILMNSFKDDRALLIKRLMAILGDLRERNSIQHDAEQAARALYVSASPFLVDKDFKFYWFTFEKNMKCFSAMKIFQNLEEDKSIEMQSKILNRYVYHSILIEAGIFGMASWLAYGVDHKEAFNTLAKTIDLNCSDVDLTFALPSRVGFNEIADIS